ncbi:MAG: methyl-accepting chemotaxis protein [Ghiorsea sp.]
MANIRLWITELTIAQRLSFIGVLAALGMVLVGSIHTSTVRQISSLTEESSAGAKLMEKLDGLTIHLFAEHLNTQDYLKYSDKKSEAKWKIHSQEKGELLTYLSEFLPTSIMRNHMQSVAENAKEFETIFRQAKAQRKILGFNENEGLSGTFRSTVHEAESTLKQHNQDKLMVSMLMLRRHEKDFMLRDKAKYIEKYKKELSKFKKILKASPLKSSQKELVWQKMEAYRDAFIAYGEHRILLLDALGDMEAVYQESIVPKLENTDAELAKYLVELNKSVGETIVKQGVIFWATLLLAMLVIGAVIMWLRSSIIRPLREVTEAMDVLERGEIKEVSSPMKGAIAELIDSLVVFQSQALETSLLKRVVQSSPQATMLADKDTLVISYLNDAATALFSSIESSLPCKASDLVGKNIDIFHKNPSYQRQALHNESSFPIDSSFMIGGRNIAFSAHAIINDHKQWVSIMVAWNDVTEEAQMASDFETNVGTMVEEVISSAVDLQKSSDTLTEMAELSLSEVTNVSDGVNTANQNTTEASAAAEQLSNSVSHIMDQLKIAVQMSSEAVDEAETTNVTVGKLSSVSEEIGEVVRVITDIAEQTNLLALNASIEAARAGEAGRGFAVVAGEVKELANQTARATEQISKQILAIQSESTGAAKAIQHIGETIQKMNETNEAIASATEQQNQATQNIVLSMHAASSASEQVRCAIDGVNSAAQSTEQATQQVNKASQVIHEKGKDLSGRVSHFLASLRKG